MWQRRRFWLSSVVMMMMMGINLVIGESHRILLDTDVDTDDFFALLYLLKLNRTEFQLEGVTISTNAWTNAGHSVNHVYDLLYMMGRDDVAVGVGGEGGILENGTILPNVGGYLPVIQQGMTTYGDCRYRQVIPVGLGGRLDIDTNYGFRKSFLPQGKRRYSPMRQPTPQEVLMEKVSRGPISILMIGAHTNIALFLMSNPHLKKNIQHIYVMGGGIRSNNPTGCCPKNTSSSGCKPRQCGDSGNLFTDYTSNPYAEFNIFADPFAAYQVIHSGIPITFVPLDATNTIPINEKFFNAFELNQHTYEAQYIFRSLKMARDTWFDNQFYTSYFMWDSFLAGVAVSSMRNSYSQENEFAEMEFINITVVTSNPPYGVSDGSNPLFDGRKLPKFQLKKGGVHSGHVQSGLRDSFCLAKQGKGLCKDGYTEEINGPESVRVNVATRAKPNPDKHSELDRYFYKSFLQVLNKPEQAGRFNFTTEFPYYKEVLYKPDFGTGKLGKPVVFDMDMSPGDFLALFYLLKLPVQLINLKAIVVSPTGWANAATIDVIYDLLHMMGRDEIPVGLGDVFATNQSDPIFPPVGDCKYIKAIPHGSGGFLDSDTLYGLARDLPRSPRRYTAENSVKFGAPRDTDHPELRQPLAPEIWESVFNSVEKGSKITVLTNGPLTNLAKLILSKNNITSLIQEVYIVGGHINETEQGNVFSVGSNRYAEFNMYLDPLAAKTVFASQLNITLIPLTTQKKVSSYYHVVKRLGRENKKNTPEVKFVRRLLSRLYHLKKSHPRYQHVDMFLGEVAGAVLLGGDHSLLKPIFEAQVVKVIAEGSESKDGQVLINKNGSSKAVKILKSVDSFAVYDLFLSYLRSENQSAKIASFDQQRKIWTTPPSNKGT